MLKIEFDTFYKESDKITFNVKTFEGNNLIKDDEIYFKFDTNIDINDNLLAIALSTFCGDKYDEIYFELNLHEKIINNISKFTQTTVKSKSIDNRDFLVENKNKIGLNFSGGFDSLAEKFLLGDLAELISVYFYGNEYNFFKKFKPHILETNFRQLGYANNSHSFMGVGSILYSNFLKLKSHTFGTVFEAYYLHASKEFSSQKQCSSYPFSFIDVSDIKLIQGITEIGTALIVCRQYPYFINDSLISLSMPQTEKRYRKQLIIKTLQEKFNLNNIYMEMTQPPIEENRLTFGEDYAIDFLSLYLIKYGGVEETNKIMMNIPQEVISFVDGVSLEFYEKFNPNFLNNLPSDVKKVVIKNLAIAEIYPYDQNDFDELNEVMHLLSNYHPIIKNMFD